MLGKERKLLTLNETTKGRKLVEDENRNKEQEQQIENNNKCSRY